MHAYIEAKKHTAPNLVREQWSMCTDISGRNCELVSPYLFIVHKASAGTHTVCINSIWAATLASDTQRVRRSCKWARCFRSVWYRNPMTKWIMKLIGSNNLMKNQSYLMANNVQIHGARRMLLRVCTRSDDSSIFFLFGNFFWRCQKITLLERCIGRKRRVYETIAYSFSLLNNIFLTKWIYRWWISITTRNLSSDMLFSCVI